jgi:predicted ABC-type sugar transport system permease subunit
VILADLAGVIVLVLVVLAFAVAAYAFVHAAMQRPDAYTAAGKLTKPVWLLIIGGAGAFGLLTSLAGVSVFAIAIAAVATGIYLVDVRPKILEIQGKSR